VPENIGEVTFGARSDAFRAVIASAEVTDASGAKLDLERSLGDLASRLRALRAEKKSLYLAGNGGSAAVAAHAVTDFVNVGGVRAITLHDSSLLTCMANDYGYENAFAGILSVLAQRGEALVVISSSGNSSNVCNAALKMKELGGTVITLSGFAPDNRLRSLGDVNFWLNSRDYGMVEIGHQFVLHNVSDRLLGDRKR
jgi:D-sedoheptulose 7-phosphate isomerase